MNPCGTGLTEHNLPPSSASHFGYELNLTNDSSSIQFNQPTSRGLEVIQINVQERSNQSMVIKSVPEAKELRLKGQIK